MPIDSALAKIPTQPRTLVVWCPSSTSSHPPPVPVMGRRRNHLTRREGLLSTDVGEFENHGILSLLFETPSGFAIFTTSEYYLSLPGIVKNVWGRFRCELLAHSVVILDEFQTFEYKSAAIDDTGVNQQLACMIKRHHLPGTKLGVAKPEYKRIIESKLGISCLHNEAVMEVMWGIEYLMHVLIPDEKAKLTKEDRLPMSQGLKMLLSRYGFDVEPEMVNEHIVAAAQSLFACDAVELDQLKPLRNAAFRLKAVSGIKCEHWDALKLATAQMVLCFPEEENKFLKVLTQDELSKLKGDAPKYKDILYKGNCMRMYKALVSAHLTRLAKIKLLRSLLKKAKKAREAEQAEVREKGKPHGDSEQIPQEHVFFANLCRMIVLMISLSQPFYVQELPQPKVLKRSWDSAFEATGANKSIFSEGLAFGETLNRRIARSFSGAQRSTSKAIIPYVPVRDVVFLRVDNTDADRNINVGKSIPEQVETLGIEATPLASAGDSGDEAITAELLAEHSEQNVVNILQNVKQSAYGKSLLQQERVQAHGLNDLPGRP